MSEDIERAYIARLAAQALSWAPACNHAPGSKLILESLLLGCGCLLL